MNHLTITPWSRGRISWTFPCFLAWLEDDDEFKGSTLAGREGGMHSSSSSVAESFSILDCRVFPRQLMPMYLLTHQRSKSHILNLELFTEEEEEEKKIEEEYYDTTTHACYLLLLTWPPPHHHHLRVTVRVVIFLLFSSMNEQPWSPTKTSSPSIYPMNAITISDA